MSMCSCRALHGPPTVLRHLRSQRPKFFSNSAVARTKQVTALSDWNLDQFKQNAFDPQLPAVLPYLQHTVPKACSVWFIHENNSRDDLTRQPRISELRTSFWSQFEDIMVPLELIHPTSTSTDDVNHEVEFHRHEAPLKILLEYLQSNRQQTATSTSAANQQASPSIYLAQCDLRSLPVLMQEHLPTPNLVQYAGRGDIYSSSLWLGRPPTHTPLHRDPNPNLFIQLAGRKAVRLFAPDVGNAIFDTVQEQLATLRSETRGTTRASPSFRGEEMMQGPEKRLLHKIVWSVDGGNVEDNDGLLQSGGFQAYALEARLGLGEALFIPKGWWHSVKGIGEGITASANWWFR